MWSIKEVLPTPDPEDVLLSSVPLDFYPGVQEQFPLPSTSVSAGGFLGTGRVSEGSRRTGGGRV